MQCCEDAQWSGALLEGLAGRVRTVQPEEEKAPERSQSTFQYLEGLQESWRGTWDRNML